MIQVRGLKMYYNYGKIKALDGVDIDINRGDVMVVIGPSGSGKSTFLRSLNLLESPTDGSIIFEDKDIVNEKINLDQYRQKMGMVFQHFNLFPHKTILENLTLAPMIVKHESKEAAWSSWSVSVSAIVPRPTRCSYPVVRSSVSRSCVHSA